jgi:iron(III) transport system substrate-binding protein
MKRRAFFGVIASTAVAAAGCSPSATSPSKKQSQVVNLYSARHYDTDQAIYDNFTKQTGIKVNLIEAEADKLIERILSEGANSPADVLMTVDAGRLWRAQQAGVLQPVPSQTLKAAIPENLREPEGHWFGFAKRVRVIVYNKSKVKPEELSTYEDLVDPKWKGRLMVRSSNNIYNQSLGGSILAQLGPQKTEAWAKGVVANLAKPPEGNDVAQIKAVAAGQADISLVNSYYLVRLAKSDKPENQELVAKVGVFYPNQGDRGAHVNVSGGGLVKTAPNREAGIKFLEYLASPEAQAMFAGGNHEYPAVLSVKPDPLLASFGSFKEDSLNAAVYGKNNAEALQIMDRAGWK